METRVESLVPRVPGEEDGGRTGAGPGLELGGWLQGRMVEDERSPLGWVRFQFLFHVLSQDVHPKTISWESRIQIPLDPVEEFLVWIYNNYWKVEASVLPALHH